MEELQIYLRSFLVSALDAVE